MFISADAVGLDVDTGLICTADDCRMTDSVQGWFNFAILQVFFFLYFVKCQVIFALSISKNVTINWITLYLLDYN